MSRDRRVSASGLRIWRCVPGPHRLAAIYVGVWLLSTLAAACAGTVTPTPAPAPLMVTATFVTAAPAVGSTIQVGNGSTIDVRGQLSVQSNRDVAGKIFSGVVGGTIPQGCIVALPAPQAVTLRAAQPQSLTLGPYRFVTANCAAPFVAQGVAYEMVPSDTPTSESGQIVGPVTTTYFNTGVNWALRFVQ